MWFTVQKGRGGYFGGDAGTCDRNFITADTDSGPVRGFWDMGGHGSTDFREGGWLGG